MIVHEQLSFQDALSLATKRIFETKGRSRRSEFWWAMLVAYFISNFLPPFWLVTIPISIRRLHDTGRSGWWMFFPVVATIIIVSIYKIPCSGVISRPAASTSCRSFFITSAGIHLRSTLTVRTRLRLRTMSIGA